MKIPVKNLKELDTVIKRYVLCCLMGISATENEEDQRVAFDALHDLKIISDTIHCPSHTDEQKWKKVTEGDFKEFLEKLNVEFE